MKELSPTINKRGFLYRQEFASDKGYIYSQTLNGVLLGYEVFLRKENTHFNCVSFPGDNAFGVWAWTTKTLERAKQKLTERIV